VREIQRYGLIYYLHTVLFIFGGVFTYQVRKE